MQPSLPHEIVAIPGLPDGLVAENTRVTLDATGCQKDGARRVRDAGRTIRRRSATHFSARSFNFSRKRFMNSETT